MTIQFYCPSCQFEFNVADSMGGTRARCNRCGTVLDVPFAGEDAPIDLARLADQTALATHRRTVAGGTDRSAVARSVDSDSKRRILVFSVIGGAATLILLFVVLALLSGNDDEVAESDAGNNGRAAAAGNLDEPTVDRSIAAPLSTRITGSVASSESNPFAAASRASSTRSLSGDSGEQDTVDNESPFQPVSPGNTASTPVGADESPFVDVESSPFEEVASAPASSGSTSDESPFVEADENPFIEVGADTTAPSRRPTSSQGSGAEGKGQSLSAGGWQAEPDPPPQPIPVKEGRLSLALPPNSDILYPLQASQFVLVGAGTKEDIDYGCFDLSTGLVFGQTILDGITLKPPRAISADGKYLAGINGDGDEAKLEVWSFESASRVAEFDLASDRDVGIFFAGPDQIAATHNDFFKGLSMRMWSISQQRRLWEKQQLLPSEQLRGANGFAVSHGGRYAVILANARLRLLNLANGEGLGTLPLNENPSRCYGLAFSPDGKELAALNEISSGAQLVIWDFTNGNELLNHPYYEQLEYTNYNGPALEWVPDKSGLLVAGHVLIDRETGEAIWNLPETNASPRRMLRPEQVLMVTPGDKGRKLMLSSSGLPLEEITKVRDTVRGGGKAIDSMLPPITKPDLASAQALSAPGGSVDWAYQADPAPAPTVSFKEPQLIAEESGRVQQIRFGGPNVNRVLVTREVEQKRQSGRRMPRQFVISSLDLSSGRSTSGMPLLAQYHLLDSSPDGALGLVGLQNKEGGYDRLDVLSVATKKHVAGWRPYSLEADHEHQTTTWAFMAANDRVITCNSFGRLVMWTLPDCRAVYTLDGFGEPLCFSPTRRYLMAFQKPSVRIYDLQTGECCGDLETLPTNAEIVRAAVRPDGQEAIAIADGLPNKTVFRWSLKDGRLANSFPIPDEVVPHSFSLRASKGEAGLYWIDDRYVLLDGVYLMDVENRAIVWRYHLWPSNFINVVGGKTWIVGGEDGGAFGKQVIAPLPLPSSNAREKARYLQLEKQLLLGPDSKVRLYVQMHGQYSRHNQAITDAMTQRLQEIGMQFDPSAQLLLSITSGERSTGEKIGLSNGPTFGFGAVSAEQTFSQQAIVLQFTLQDASGKAIWKKDMMIPMRSSGFVESDNAQAASAELRGEMERAFDGALSGGTVPAMLPPYVFRPLAELVAGESKLSPNGEGPPPQPEKPENNRPGFGASPFGFGPGRPFGPPF